MATDSVIEKQTTPQGAGAHPFLRALKVISIVVAGSACALATFVFILLVPLAHPDPHYEFALRGEYGVSGADTLADFTGDYKGKVYSGVQVTYNLRPESLDTASDHDASVRLLYALLSPAMLGGTRVDFTGTLRSKQEADNNTLDFTAQTKGHGLVPVFLVLVLAFCLGLFLCRLAGWRLFANAFTASLFAGWFLYNLVISGLLALVPKVAGAVVLGLISNPQTRELADLSFRTDNLLQTPAIAALPALLAIYLGDKLRSHVRLSTQWCLLNRKAGR